MRRMLILLAILLMAKTSYAYVDMDVIKQIEGGGCRTNASCIGDGGRAVSYWQIHEAVISDFNRANKTAYKPNVRENEALAREIADWYMNKMIPKMLTSKRDTLENRLTAWNMGISKVGKVSADKYIEKYRRLYAQ